MNSKSFSIATAVALLFVSGAVVGHADDRVTASPVRCFGINSCKGQSYCATAKNACAGQNACKGRGSLRVSHEEILREERPLGTRQRWLTSSCFADLASNFTFHGAA
jgi:hypothetical protein